MVPVGNANQVGPFNTYRALIVQSDESCDWSIQSENGGHGGTACYAEIINNVGDGHSF
ncbi:hypothetical protein Hanom_Chr05g00427631 [Helianthus anomalus]